MLTIRLLELLLDIVIVVLIIKVLTNKHYILRAGGPYSLSRLRAGGPYSRGGTRPYFPKIVYIFGDQS